MSSSHKKDSSGNSYQIEQSIRDGTSNQSIGVVKRDVIINDLESVLKIFRELKAEQRSTLLQSFTQLAQNVDLIRREREFLDEHIKKLEQAAIFLEKTVNICVDEEIFNIQVPLDGRYFRREIIHRTALSEIDSIKEDWRRFERQYDITKEHIDRSQFFSSSMNNVVKMHKNFIKLKEYISRVLKEESDHKRGKDFLKRAEFNELMKDFEDPLSGIRYKLDWDIKKRLDNVSQAVSEILGELKS